MSGLSLFDATHWRNPWTALDEQTSLQDNVRLSSQNQNLTTYLVGNLGADHFTIKPADRLTIISGNGNIDYGEGQYDLLDLSHLPIAAVSKWTDAAIDGILYNPGNGTRVFDGVLLADGHQILFEGLDVIQFADEAVYFSVCPNDPEFDRQWNLHMMGVHNAWRFTQGSPKILIGIQDTGLGYEITSNTIHPDLPETISPSNNLADDYTASKTNPTSDASHLTSHGTKVQSIISAISNNGEGMSGINWKSKVAHVDVIGDDADDLNLEEATRFLLESARAQGQRLVVNLSLCIGNASSIENHLLHQAFEQLVEANRDNVLFVVSVGNENRDRISYPASLGKQHRNVIAVGAVWGRKNRWWQTEPGTRVNYEATGSNYGSGLSLMGPAEVIAASASMVQGEVQFDFDPMFKGTSAAAPNVAGVASLVWSLCPELSAEQVHYILIETAYRGKGNGYTLETGYGLVEADAAVRRAIAIQTYLRQSQPTAANHPKPSKSKPSSSKPSGFGAPMCLLAS